MSIRAWDEANEARAEGVEQMATGAVLTVRAVAEFANQRFEQGCMDIARAAEAYADGGRLLSTPLPELAWWQRGAVWLRSKWRRAVKAVRK